MRFCGTISATCLTVGLSGFANFTGLWCNRFRLASVVGRAMIRGIPLRGGRLKDGKIWLEEDWTEQGIATELLKAGVPKEAIVLAFQPPEMRQLSEFAVA